METNFTKGKWKINKTYAQGKKCNWVRILNENKNLIAEVEGVHCGIKTPEMNANAKLIAAAPDLFNAILQLVDRIENNWDLITSGTQNGIKTALISEAREAIKKATE